MTRTSESIPDYVSYDNIIGRRIDTRIYQGLQALGGGQFKDLVKPEVGRGGEPNFGMLENGQYPNPMSAEQAQALDRLSADPQVGLSQDTRDAIRDISRCMDELHYERCSGVPLSGQTFPLQRPAKQDAMYYPGEEGRKYYAFKPVTTAKQALVAAVESGDLEKVRQAQQAFEQAEAATDRALGILRSDKLNQAPVFSPNVESTRSNTGDVPEKYATDSTNQKKLNSLYIGCATLKSAGLTLEELCRDPAKTARTLGQRLLAAGGLSARRSTATPRRSERTGASRPSCGKRRARWRPARITTTPWARSTWRTPGTGS